MSFSATAKIALSLCGAGVTLHAYTVTFKAAGDASAFLLGLLLVSCTPYAIAAALAWNRREVLGLGAAAACLVADMFMHYSVFFAPKSSTAALGLLFMPIGNLVAVGPLGALLFWLGHKAVGAPADAI